MKIYSNTYTTLIFISLIIITICIIIFNRKIHSTFTDYFDCYLKLSDINPQLINAYMKYDNKHVANGKCENARLHISITPCPTDENGVPSDKCHEGVNLISSKGNPLVFPYDISPGNVGKYFGI